LPLPIAPSGGTGVGAGVDLVENDEGGAVFVWGAATWCWDAGDVVGRRLAAVQAVETGAAQHQEVAEAFVVDEVTLRRWRHRWRAGGVAGLVPAKRGPKGPSKLDEGTVDEIRARRAEGASMDAIAVAVGLSRDTVARALRANRPGGVSPTDVQDDEAAGELAALARPEPREEERQAARRGELSGAAPVICEGRSQPLAGALMILPALAATGLVECFGAVYDKTRAAFYGLRSLVLAVVFAALVGEARAEGLTRLDPVDLGRLLGLDRAPEVKTLRRRMEELAGLGRSDALLEALARRHVEGHQDAAGVFYVDDGHVRAYHGGADVAKAHVARMRLSMPAAVDTWVADAFGDGVLVWAAPPGASLAGELRRAAESIRALVGPERRPTIAFDRGGWSPKLFAELVAGGFDVLTYRKGPVRPEPRRAFREYVFTDETGRRHHYWLADRRVRVSYDNGRRRFACRQIVRLDPKTGHQTQIITTRDDPDPAALAHAMFSRWRQENFFRYLRAHYALDALDAYATTNDDPSRLVPNPTRRQADREVRDAKRRLADAEAEEGRAALAGRRHPADTAGVRTAFDAALAEIARLEAAAKTIPAKVPLGDIHPDAARLDPERKRLHDAIRMATYNAESTLARLLAPHYARAEDEARSLLQEAFRAPADLQVIGTELHVRLNPLSAPRRSRAIAELCAELTATQTTYPGTDLTLVYSVINQPPTVQ
jgi:transposase